MPVEVFQEPIRRRYYTRHLSCSYMFFLLTVAVMICLPFFLAYGSFGFWLKTSKYYEQPTVSYKYKFITQLQGTDSNNDPFQIFYSSAEPINSLRDNVRIPTVKTKEVDNNIDGKSDALSFSYSMPLKQGEKVNSVNTILFFDYQLADRVRINMESLAYISHSDSLQGSSYYTKGNLDFVQVAPMPVGGSGTCEQVSGWEGVR